MTTDTIARVPVIRPTMTLAGLIEQYRADPDLPLRRRQELIAAMNTLGRALGKPLQDIPAHPAALRAALKNVSPAMAGVSEGRWRNVLSLLRGACPCRHRRRPGPLPRGAVAGLGRAARPARGLPGAPPARAS